MSNMFTSSVHDQSNLVQFKCKICYRVEPQDGYQLRHGGTDAFPGNSETTVGASTMQSFRHCSSSEYRTAVYTC